MPDFFWSTKNANGQDVRCEGGEVVHVDPKSMSAIAGDAGNFVWMPGGVQQGNVYNNWKDLAAAIAALPGQKTVTVDTSLGAAHITTGNYAGIVSTTFVAGDATGVLVIVHIDDGAHFTYPAAAQTRLSFDGVAVDVGNTTAAFISATGSQTFELFFQNASSLACSGTKAFVDFAGTSQMVCWVESDSLIETGTIDPFNVSGGTPTLDFFVFTGGVIQNSVIATSGGAGTVVIVGDGSSQPLISLSQSIAPTVTILDPISTFVFKPGGVAGKNVFTDWTSLANAVSLTPGPRTILIDDSLAAAHMVSGTWDLDNVTLSASLDHGFPVLIVDEGALITSASLAVRGALTLQCSATATIPWTPTSFFLFLVDTTSLVKSSGAIPLLRVQAAATQSVMQLSGATLGDGTHNAITVNVGQTLNVLGLGPSTIIAAHAFGGLGTVLAQRDACTSVSATQDVSTFTITNQDVTSRIGYTAGTAGNWNPNPTVLNAALDQLAASNTQVGTGNTGTGTGTVTVSTANITKAKNGKMLVNGSCALSTSAACTLTITLKRDGTTTVGTAKTLVAAAAVNALDVTISATDTAPDTAAHNYQLSVTASAGNITVAANSAQVEVVEDS